MDKANGESGISLVEVVVTLGLLAFLLLSTLGLFVIGQKQVQSARAGTQALAAARGILEEMNGWSYVEIFERFGLDGTAAAYTVDSRTNGYAAQWQAGLDRDLASSLATVRIESLTFAGETPPIASGRGVRVVVTVLWDEASRHRKVEIGTARF